MSESVNRRLIKVGAFALVAGLLSACSVGSDDGVDPTATVTSPIESALPSPSATSTIQPPTVTATLTPLPPTSTRTPTPRPTATVTPVPKVPLGTITALDPAVLTNYTLAADIQLRGVPGQPDFATSLLILQSAPDLYYLRSTTGEGSIETWLVDGTTYLTQADGSVAKLPDATDTALFSPALLVQTIPAISGETLGVDRGTEDVGGRQASRYQIEATDLFATTPWLPGDGANDVTGQVDVWIDDETRVVVRQVSDVRWTNPDGSAGSFAGQYEITNVTTTEPVTAPG